MASLKPKGNSTGAATEPTNHRRRIFISGLDCINQVGGGNLEFVLSIVETVDGQSVIRPLEESIVMHISALPDAIGKALMAMGRQVLVTHDGAITVKH